MKKLFRLVRNLSLFVLVFISNLLYAQNWDPVMVDVKNYYYLFQPFAFPLKMTENNQQLLHGAGNLRVVWTKSKEAIGNGDSMFKFQSDITIPFPEDCIDTAGPTIFGKKYVLTSDNDIFFFNNNNDSMRIKPTASLNETWMFYNANGNQYQAKVASIETELINDEIDSVKRIDISLMQGVGRPDAYLYISKKHGITHSFHMASFPDNSMAYIDYDLLESNNYLNSLSFFDYAKEKYQIGNFWVTQTDTFYYFGVEKYSIHVHSDTVVSSSIIPPNQIQYTLKRNLNGAISYITNTKSFSINSINYLSGISPGYYSPNENYTLQDALKSHSIAYLSDSSFQLRETSFGYETRLDSCYYISGLVNYETYTRHSNRYFEIMKERTYKLWAAYEYPFEDLGSSIIYYKIGDHVYAPPIFVGLDKMKLNAQFEDAEHVKLNWEVFNEKQIERYEIQRSVDNKQFEKVSSINTNGGNSEFATYQFLDDITAISEGKSILYQIAAYDINNKIQYSNLEKVIKLKKNFIQVYPNPFSNELTISMSAPFNNSIVISMSDLSGRQINDLKFDSELNSNSVKIVDLNFLKRGIYQLNILNNETGIREIFKVVKE